MTSGNTQTATYHWLADGTKYRVADASGNGVIYAGDLTYAVTVSGGNTTYALESAEASADGTARFLKNGTAMTPYYTIRDHLGSVRTIVNASGTVVERNDYYPFGSRTTFGNTYATLASNRQRFSGKEDQTTVAGSSLPYLDFGARMYDAKLVRWNTYDPMAEKYYGINPYVYCNGDPVNFVDPRGNDIWEINKQGEVVSKKPDIKQDAFFIVTKDDNGNYQRAQTTDANGDTVDVGISFEYGTVNDISTTKRTIDSKGNIKSKHLTLFEVKGDDNATQLFEFMANPFEATIVEWTYAKTEKKKTERNIVGTSHSNTSTFVGHYLWQDGYMLFEVTHNHPDGNGRPSLGDKERARDYYKNNSNIILNVYIHPGHYIRYNQDGVIPNLK